MILTSFRGSLSLPRSDKKLCYFTTRCPVLEIEVASTHCWLNGCTLCSPVPFEADILLSRLWRCGLIFWGGGERAVRFSTSSRGREVTAAATELTDEVRAGHGVTGSNAAARGHARSSPPSSGTRNLGGPRISGLGRLACKDTDP